MDISRSGPGCHPLLGNLGFFSHSGPGCQELETSRVVDIQGQSGKFLLWEIVQMFNILLFFGIKLNLPCKNTIFTNDKDLNNVF